MSRRVSRRGFFAVALLVAFLIAGVGSYYASSHPDGLNHVAEQTGFSATEKTDGPAQDSPLAGYSTKGVEDDRLSGGIAGVAGVGLTLALGGGLFWFLRRRPTESTAPTGPAGAAAPAGSSGTTA